jgi:hypothetical protein
MSVIIGCCRRSTPDRVPQLSLARLSFMASSQLDFASRVLGMIIIYIQMVILFAKLLQWRNLTTPIP